MGALGFRLKVSDFPYLSQKAQKLFSPVKQEAREANFETRARSAFAFACEGGGFRGLWFSVQGFEFLFTLFRLVFPRPWTPRVILKIWGLFIASELGTPTPGKSRLKRVCKQFSTPLIKPEK